MVRFQKIVGIDETTRSMAVFASSPVHISYHIGAELRAIRPAAPGLNVLMPIEAIVEALNTYQPEVISTYPSFVRVLAGEDLHGLVGQPGQVEEVAEEDRRSQLDQPDHGQERRR